MPLISPKHGSSYTKCLAVCMGAWHLLDYKHGRPRQSQLKLVQNNPAFETFHIKCINLNCSIGTTVDHWAQRKVQMKKCKIRYPLRARRRQKVNKSRTFNGSGFCDKTLAVSSGGINRLKCTLRHLDLE